MVQRPRTGRSGRASGAQGPYKDASVLQAKLLKHGTLKIYPGFPHGMMTTHAGVINADILAFIKGPAVGAA